MKMTLILQFIASVKAISGHCGEQEGENWPLFEFGVSPDGSILVGEDTHKFVWEFISDYYLRGTKMSISGSIVKKLNLY